jgi:hypothetical protein
MPQEETGDAKPKAAPRATNSAKLDLIALRLSTIEAKLSEKPASKDKDIWDKLGALTTLISSVVLGGAGLIATNWIQAKDLEIKHLDAHEQTELLAAQDKEHALIEETKTFVSLYDYVAAPEETKRTFGYAMFSAFGRDDLVLKFITAARDDKAGLTFTRDLLARTSDSSLVLAAQSTLDKLRPPPLGPAPYHFRLDNVLSAAEMARITQAGALTFQVTGNTGGVADPQPQMLVADAMRRALQAGPPEKRPSFLYLLGNIVFFYGEAQYYFDQFYRPYAQYPGPIFAIPGNHDGAVPPTPNPPVSLAAYTANFNAREPKVLPEAGNTTRTAMTEPNSYWTLQTPFATIIGLYTNILETGIIDDQQRSWLKSELEAAPLDRALILALHHSPFNFVGAHVTNSLTGEIQNAINLSRRVPNLILSAAIFNYQRIEVDAAQGLVVPFLVVGNGGYHNIARLRVRPPSQDAVEKARLVAGIDDRYGFATLEITSEEINGRFTAVRRSPTPDATAENQADVFKYSAKPIVLEAGRNVILGAPAAAGVAAK